MKKRLICTLLVLALCLTVLPLGLATTAQAISPEVVDEVRNGTVAVYNVYDSDNGEYPISRGTGFFVGEDGEAPTYLVTNHHVVADYINNGQGTLVDAFYIPIDGETYVLDTPGRVQLRIYFDDNDYAEAYLVDYDEIADVAVLKLSNPTDRRRALPLLVPTSEMSGQPISAIGYPSVSDNVYANPTSNFDTGDSTVTVGHISRTLTTSGEGTATIQVDLNFSGGNSGGPVVDDDGNVLGLTTYHVFVDGDTAGYAINISEAIELLDSNAIPYELGIGVLGGGSVTWIIILIVSLLVAAGVAVLVILLVKKGGKKNVAPPPRQPEGPKELRIQGVTGTHAGKRYSVNGSVRLGRDPQCDISYPANTKGVSGYHCAISNRAGHLYITDLGSTYGTYLNDQRLTPNAAVELRLGDRFWLASENELFCIDVKGGA